MSLYFMGNKFQSSQQVHVSSCSLSYHQLSPFNTRCQWLLSYANLDDFWMTIQRYSYSSKRNVLSNQLHKKQCTRWHTHGLQLNGNINFCIVSNEKVEIICQGSNSIIKNWRLPFALHSRDFFLKDWKEPNIDTIDTLINFPLKFVDVIRFFSQT